MAKKLPAIAVLYSGTIDSGLPIVVMNEGQDFEGLINEWLDHDQKVEDGEVSEDDALDLEAFLVERGVTVIEDVPVYQVPEMEADEAVNV